MRLYVDNLAYATSEEKLRNAFAAHGAVGNCHIPLDQRTGIYKGYAYVVMPDDAEAKAAIKALNESLLDGKQLVVRESRNKKRKAPPLEGSAESRFGMLARPRRRVNRMGYPRGRKTQDR